MQAAALGGQLAAHCRREGDLGLVTPQELLQSAQRQRCYLGYIPQPPQVCTYTFACQTAAAIAFALLLNSNKQQNLCFAIVLWSAAA